MPNRDSARSPLDAQPEPGAARIPVLGCSYREATSQPAHEVGPTVRRPAPASRASQGLPGHPTPLVGAADLPNPDRAPLAASAPGVAPPSLACEEQTQPKPNHRGRPRAVP